MSTTRSGRSSLTPAKDNKELQVELKLLTNIKHFFKEKEVDVADVIEMIRVSKRNDDPKAYWQLYYLVFLAFFLDHSQNDYLREYFTF